MARINQRTLHKYCTSSITDIFTLTGADVTTIPGVGRYGFIDNGGDVLAVAHLDISPTIAPYQGQFIMSKNKVHSVALDDRLGAYIICDFLPRLGLKFDILLTEGEEIGMSTARDFQTEKGYNWIFEFDRRGLDVVMYQYETNVMRQLLTDSGFTVGHGSFSDISELDFMGVKAFNFGCGYYREHTRTCFADMRHTAKMVDLFKAFFNANKDIKWDHDPLASRYGQYLHADDDYAYLDNYNAAWDYVATPDGSEPWGLPHDKYYDQDREVWEVAERVWDEYGVNITDLTFDDYCVIVGIHPTDREGWIKIDYTMYRLLELSESPSKPVPLTWPKKNSSFWPQTKRLNAVNGDQGDDDPGALTDVDVNQCLGCGDTDEPLLNGHCHSCDTTAEQDELPF